MPQALMSVQAQITMMAQAGFVIDAI